MVMVRKLISVILIVSTLISTTGCTSIGYFAGSALDSKLSTAGEVPVELINQKLNVGDDVIIVLVSNNELPGDTLRGRIKRMEGSRLFLPGLDSGALMNPQVDREIEHASIHSISLIERTTYARYAGFTVGLTVDVAFILYVVAMSAMAGLD